MIEFRDPVVGEGEYRLVWLHGWRRCSAGFLSGRVGTPETRFIHLQEWGSATWIPADPAREWGRDEHALPGRRWLLGDEDAARAAGVPLDRPTPWAGRVVARFGDFTASAQDRVPAPRPASWTTPTPAFLAGLPRDPATLIARLLADHPRTRFAGPLQFADRALATGQYPAPLRAALYAGLTALPTITVRDPASDLDGQPRVALVATDPDTGDRHELLFDPETGNYGGQQHRTGSRTRLPVRPDTLVGGCSVTVCAVDHLGDLPTPPA